MDSLPYSPSLPRNIFRLPLWWTRFPLAGLVLLLAVGILALVLLSILSLKVVTTAFITRIVGASIFELLLVGVAAILILDAQAKIVVSAAGIEYQGRGYSLYAQWSDVERIWKHWSEAVRFWPWLSLPDKLIVRRCQLRTNHWLAVWLRFVGWDRMIPIGEFAMNWRQSELGNLIHYYAPHIDVQTENTDFA